MFYKQINIHGTTMGTRLEFEEMIHFVEEKEIKPVVDEVFALRDVELALRRMEEGEQFGKIVLKIAD